MNKLIILNGPSGVGKSTVAKMLWRKMKRTAYISLDEIKWLISDYKFDVSDLAMVDKDLTLARNIGLGMVEGFLVDGLNVIIEKPFCKKEYLEPYLDLAEKLGIPYSIFNIEASLQTLLTRAKERTLKEDRKFSEEKVKRIYSEYVTEKIEAKTFDADKNSSEEIADMIFDLV